MLRIQLVTGTISLFFLIIVFEAIRRRKFMEKYALLWIFSGLLVLMLSIFPTLLFKLAQFIGLYYLTVLSLLSFLFLLLILLYLSITISNISEKNKELAQEIGLLKFKVEQLEKDTKSEQRKID
ncbi:MAG: DUF2304 domain-containing protein [Deltaproteobacteria bacterium]